MSSYDPLDLRGQERSKAERELRERLAREALDSQVKFARMARWRIADHLYLCCPGGLLKANEIPAGWGWIEISRGALRVRRAAPDLGSPPTRRWRMVRNVDRARP